MELWWWPDIGLGTVSTSGEWKEVSQEDMVRVSESMQKAAQMWAQTRWDSKQNAQVAKYLEFLFGEIKSDEIWWLLLDVCTKHDSSWTNMVIAVEELVMITYPFFRPQFEENWLKEVFQHQLPSIAEVSLDSYVSYLRDVNYFYELIKQTSNEKLAKLAVALLEYFGYSAIAPEKKQEVYNDIIVRIG